MRTVNAILRLIFFFLLLCIGLMIAGGMRLLCGENWHGRHYGARIKLGWMRGAAKILGLQIKIHGFPPKNNALWVANHISWLDAVAISAIHPISFIAKADVRNWPIVGLLAQLSGTLFLNRSKRRDVASCLSNARALLASEVGVAFFPEATTTDGRTLHTFKPSLFAAAIPDHPVQAIAMRYHTARDGRHYAPFIGDDKFIAHLWKVLKAPGGTHVDVSFCAPIFGADRKILANRTETQIRALLSIQSSFRIEFATAPNAAHAASEF